MIEQEVGLDEIMSEAMRELVEDSPCRQCMPGCSELCRDVEEYLQDIVEPMMERGIL